MYMIMFGRLTVCVMNMNIYNLYINIFINKYIHINDK